ncbi:MAG: Na+/H+ antiporter subunit E [Burkholderiales bacterium]
MRHTLFLTVVLFAFWVLLSGLFTPFLLGSGLVSAYWVARVAVRMEVADREGQPFHLGAVALAYWSWLAKEIAKAAWGVTRIIVDPRLPISPTMTRFKPMQESSVGLVTHANSITLTPGTITVEAKPEEFVVHALTAAGAASVLDSEMDRRVRRFERGG